MFKTIKHLRPDLSLSEFSSINIIEGNHAERRTVKELRRLVKEGGIKKHFELKSLS